MNNIHVNNLLKTCNSNKTTKWYTDAFGVLINYYIDLLDITVDSNLRGSKFRDDSQLESNIIELMRSMFSFWKEHYNKAHN